MKEQILLQKLIAAGRTQVELAKRLSTTQQSISLWARGKREPSGPAKKLIRDLAKEAGIGGDAGARAAPPATGVPEFSRAPVVGRIGAGSEIEIEFDQSTEGAEVAVLPFYLPAELIVLEIKGDSMLPVYEDGDFVVCYRDQHRPTDWFLGKRAAVRTTDGRRFLKRVTRGPSRGLYNLESWNASTIEGVRIEWVGQIVGTVSAELIQLIEPAQRPTKRRAAGAVTKRRGV